MKEHITQNREGFPFGLSSVTTVEESECSTGIEFTILKLRRGESYEESSFFETAYLHLSGTVTLSVKDQAKTNTRKSLFDEAPFCLHVPQKIKVKIQAETDVELAICRTENPKTFPTEWYTPQSVSNEQRGAGQVEGTCHRWVRTIFDDRNSHSNAELVLGEVVNMPGRWSSYPPHHHPQPEIYHYRFTDPRGFGHAELGDDVLRVKQYDTVKILDMKDHAQCSAPGYGMYYIWVIRHLPSLRYDVPEFTEDHRWTMEEEAPYWRPQEEALV